MNMIERYLEFIVKEFIVHMPVFDSAIIKLLKHDETALTLAEKTAAESLLIQAVNTVGIAEDIDTDDFATEVLKKKIRE